MNIFQDESRIDSSGVTLDFPSLSVSSRTQNDKQLNPRDAVTPNAKPVVIVVQSMARAGPSISPTRVKILIATCLRQLLRIYPRLPRFAEPKSTMPVKCSFCRRRYTRAGAYETHLRRAHSNLDIILATTIRTPLANRITESATDILDNGDPSERPDSDYESDPASDPAAYHCDANAISAQPTYQPDTEILNVNTSSVAAGQRHYPGAGEAIGDVEGYDEELHNLCQDAWAPFTNAQGFKLASWFIESKVPKSRINGYFSNGLGNSASVGYTSMHTLENLLRSLDPYGPYLRWFEGQVEDEKRTLPFFYRNVLDCVRYLLRQITYRDDLVYAPRREYDQ